MVMKKHIKLLIIIIFAALAVSCFPKKKEEHSGPTPEEIANTFVVINGERINKQDYKNFTSYTYSVMDIGTRDNAEIREAVEKDFIEHRLLLQKAKEEGVTVDDEQFQEIVESFQTIKGQKKLSEFEKELNLDFETLQQLLKQRIIIGKILERVAGTDVEISEDDLKKFYEEKKNELTSDKNAHIQHIVTYDEKSAQNALALIKQGIPFSEVAEKFSVAPEKNNGGDLGFIEVNNYPDIFKEALTLKKGQVSGIVKSDYGFHIFKLIDVEKKNKVSFDDLKKKLYAELYGIKQEKKVREYIDGLYQNSEIIYPDSTSGGDSSVR
jgi:parvulin-like peptidyl-prolyl isomerase